MLSQTFFFPKVEHRFDVAFFVAQWKARGMFCVYKTSLPYQLISYGRESHKHDTLRFGFLSNLERCDEL
jgi:hypothetical protein